jgi:hypothetical protein
MKALIDISIFFVKILTLNINNIEFVLKYRTWNQNMGENRNIGII